MLLLFPLLRRAADEENKPQHGGIEMQVEAQAEILFELQSQIGSCFLAERLGEVANHQVFCSTAGKDVRCQGILRPDELQGFLEGVEIKGAGQITVEEIARGAGLLAGVQVEHFFGQQAYGIQTVGSDQQCAQQGQPTRAFFE